jgi:hypothetical protein
VARVRGVPVSVVDVVDMATVVDALVSAVRSMFVVVAGVLDVPFRLALVEVVPVLDVQVPVVREVGVVSVHDGDMSAVVSVHVLVFRVLCVSGHDLPPCGRRHFHKHISTYA